MYNYDILYKTYINCSLIVLFIPSIWAQEQLLKYKVLFKGDNIGNMSCFQKQDGDNTYLKLVSCAQLQMLMKIKINLEEESMFKNGKLLYSSSLKTVNGKEKLTNKLKPLIMVI